MIYLETNRLYLRPPQRQDFDAFADMWADPALFEHLPMEPFARAASWTKFLNMAGNWAIVDYGNFFAFDKSDDRLLGQIGFFDASRGFGPDFDTHRELGYVFLPTTAGQGIATEAGQAAQHWMDQQNFGDRTVCMMSPDNIASIRVAKKCGYSLLRETADEHGDVHLMYRDKP